MSQPNDLKRLLPRHYKIMELLLDGLSYKQVADQVGMSPQGIRLIARSPLFQHEMARRREALTADLDRSRQVAQAEAQQVLNQNALAAAQTHVDLLHDDDSSVRQRSATEILNRVFGKEEQRPVQAVQINVEQLQLLNLAAKEAQEFDDQTASEGPQ